VGHVQRGDAETGLDAADLLTELNPHAGVERGQWLVEQEHPGLDGQGSRQRHPLLLAT
jgi:hypothetical protein